jgi:hypothetical protein
MLAAGITRSPAILISAMPSTIEAVKPVPKNFAASASSPTMKSAKPTRLVLIVTVPAAAGAVTVGPLAAPNSGRPSTTLVESAPLTSTVTSSLRDSPGT